MILQTSGHPYVDQDKTGAKVQRIIATYDPRQDCTTINYDVDIVTLGIAVSVLQDAYKRSLKALDPQTANTIQTTIRKAVDNESHRGWYT